MTDCPFCQRIAADEFDGHVRRACVTFEPLNPVTPGHRLVVPITHFERAEDDPERTSWAFRLAAELAREKGLASFNLITSAGTAATQTVKHLHVHLVPRRPGDGLHLPWTGQKSGEAERAFLDASVAVWREIDRLDAQPDGYHPTRMSAELRQRERAAWERYRGHLDA